MLIANSFKAICFCLFSRPFGERLEWKDFKKFRINFAKFTVKLAMLLLILPEK
jgi:hypothetical protein